MKYPNKLRTCIKQKQDSIKTFTVDAFLYPPTDEELKNDKKSPYETFSCFSRYTMSLIEKKTDGSLCTVTANIPPEDVDGIWRKTLNAENLRFTEKNSSLLNTILEIVKRILEIVKRFVTKTSTSEEDDEDDCSSAGYTVAIANGTLKGKFPCNVLIEDPSQKGNLLKQKEWLKANLTKYPNNQKQIDAINDAVMRLENGMLGSTVVSKEKEGNLTDIYKVDIKIPNHRKKDGNGNTFIYSVKILFNSAMNNPFCVEIMNCKAPVFEKDGKITANMEKAVEVKRKNFMFSVDEWHKFAYDMHRLTERFEDFRFADNYDTVRRNEYKPE